MRRKKRAKVVESAKCNRSAICATLNVVAFKGQTLRIECKLVEDDRLEVKYAMMEKMPSLKASLGENGKNAVMLRVTDATATFYKIMEPVETITF